MLNCDIFKNIFAPLSFEFKFNSTLFKLLPIVVLIRLFVSSFDFVKIWITPAIASDPYKAELVPDIISIRSTFDKLIPSKNGPQTNSFPLRKPARAVFTLCLCSRPSGAGNLYTFCTSAWIVSWWAPINYSIELFNRCGISNCPRSPWLSIRVLAFRLMYSREFHVSRI